MINENTYLLVTGGAGFIGSHTVVELLSSGYTPVIVDDFRNADKSIIAALEKITGKEVLFEDIACQQEASMEALFKKYSFAGIIHFAADKAVGESVQNPLKYYENNIGSLVAVLKLAQQYAVQNFVFSSSCTVYGNPKLASSSSMVTEESAMLPAESPYGFTKQIGERIIRDFTASNPGFKACLLRYFNPIGAHPSGLIGELPQGIPNNLLPYLMQTAFGLREKLTVFGNDYNTTDGTCIRDFIHVCDLAEAHVKAMDWLQTQTDSIVEVFNVGTGKGTSVLELIQTYEKLIPTPLNWEFGPRRDGDVPEIYSKVDKVNAVLGWKSKYTVEDSILHAHRWEENRLQHEKN
jgi:UDP-glucose 4-epimerase